MPAAEQPAPADPRLLPWPGRGPWAGDEEFVDQAAATWRASAEDPGSLPGAEVHALWAGPVGDIGVAVLQSVGQDGEPRVAQVTESRIPGSISRGALILTDTEVVGQEPPFVVLSYAGGLDLGGVLREPGTSLLQVLPAPDLLPDGVELQRQSGTAFETVDLQGDGLSEPWVHTPWLVPGGPVLAAVRTQGPYPGLLSTALIDPQCAAAGSGTGAAGPVGLGRAAHRPTAGLPGRPERARGTSDARPVGSRSSGRRRRSTATHRWSRCVRADRGVPSWSPSPREARARSSPVRVPSSTPADIAVGAVRSPDGALLVVAAAPPDTALMLIGRDGTVVARGPRTTAVWLPRDVDVSSVAAQGYRDDETWVGRTVLDVTDL